jgi:two-component sensor histidine kinase
MKQPTPLTGCLHSRELTVPPWALPSDAEIDCGLGCTCTPPEARICLRRVASEASTAVQEAHHRIKNDLQLLASLLSLQARASHSAEVRSAVLEAAGRIQMVAKIHHLLQHAVDGDIDAARLIREVCSDLAVAAGADRRGVVFHIIAEPGPLSGDRARTLAMIVHELVANTLKHAFVDGGGQVAVRFQRVGSSYRLTVADDGAGIPDTEEAPLSLGHDLIGRLARQLGGTLVFDRQGEGGLVRMEFPMLPEFERF